jgi:hypothetical protein
MLIAVFMCILVSGIFFIAANIILNFKLVKHLKYYIKKKYKRTLIWFYFIILLSKYKENNLGWKMSKILGMSMFFLYFIFVAVSLAFEYEYIHCAL